MNKYTKCFAEYMGYEIVEVGYYGTDSETKWQRENGDFMVDACITNVGMYAVNISENDWHEYYELKYTTSWDWLLDVWKKASTEIYGQPQLLAKCMATIFDVDIEKTVKNLYKLINIHHDESQDKESKKKF